MNQYYNAFDGHQKENKSQENVRDFFREEIKTSRETAKDLIRQQNELSTDELKNRSV